MTSTLPSWAWIIGILSAVAVFITLFFIVAAIGNTIYYRKKIKKFFKEMWKDIVFMLTFPPSKINI